MQNVENKNAPRLIIHDGPGRVFLLLTAVSFLFRPFGTFSDFMFQVASSAHVRFCVSALVRFIGELSKSDIHKLAEPLQHKSVPV